MIVLHPKEDELSDRKEDLSCLRRKADDMIKQLSEAQEFLREGFGGSPFQVIQVPSSEEVSDLAKQIRRVETRILELEAAVASTYAHRRK